MALSTGTKTNGIVFLLNLLKNSVVYRLALGNTSDRMNRSVIDVKINSNICDLGQPVKGRL